MNTVKSVLILSFLFCFSLFVYSEPAVKVIYWQPLDVPAPSQETLEKLQGVVSETQDFFALEMDRHGFDKKTFAVEDIIVIKGKRKLNEYRRDMASHRNIQKESDLIVDGLDNQIFVVFLGGASHIVSGAQGLSQQLCADIPEQLVYCNNMVVVSAELNESILPVTAHEIGHAFSLGHPRQRLVENKVDIMYVPLVIEPGVTMQLKEFALSKKDAVFLDNGGRLDVLPDTEIILDTDVNNDGYTDLYDCFIVRSAMSIESNYDTDINNDGITNILDLMLVKAAAFEAISAAAPSKRKVITTTWGALKQIN